MYFHLCYRLGLLAIFSLSGKITVVKSWFVIIGDDFIRAGSTSFNNCEEILSFVVIHESFIYGIVYLCGYISTSIGKTIIKCVCDDCLICYYIFITCK